jgi:hypothetical protein
LEGVRKFGMHTYMTFWIEALFLGLGVTGLGWEGKGRERERRLLCKPVYVCIYHRLVLGIA